MNIFAIDPGNIDSGFVLWDFHAGRALDFGFVPNETLLEWIDLGQFDRADRIAIEMVACYGMPVGAEIFDTCRWIGKFEHALYPRRARLITRMEVKMHLCNSARAGDPNVRQALIDRLGPVGKKAKPGPLYGITSHQLAALAVAVTAHSQK